MSLFAHSALLSPNVILPQIYSKNASSVAIFLEVVHCSIDEYLRKILQHLHELHRKGPYFLCCDNKDAMTVNYDTEKNEKIKNDLNHNKTIYFWKASKERIILKQQWTKSDDE